MSSLSLLFIIFGDDNVCVDIPSNILTSRFPGFPPIIFSPLTQLFPHPHFLHHPFVIIPAYLLTSMTL